MIGGMTGPQRPQSRTSVDRPPAGVPGAKDEQRAGGNSDVVPVRISDVRRLQLSGPPRGVRLPRDHGGTKGPRYPSPTTLRHCIGVAIDVVIHGGVGFAVTEAMAGRSAYALLFGIGAFLVLSIVHRILLQRVFWTTLGKALVGLRLIRADTGGPPTLGALLKAWFYGLFVSIALALDAMQ